MRLNFFDVNLPAFALQLNGTSLKFIQLHQRGRAVGVQGYSYAPLPPKVMNNDTITDGAALAGVIESALQQPKFGHITTRNVVVSLPESKSFVRVIHLPHMDETEVENAVLFEAEAYIPLPIDQVYFDWQILGEINGRMAVLIVASPKEAVDSYIGTLEKAHLKVIAMEVESQSLRRALIAPDSQETILIVDIDSFKTNLIMVEKGSLQFTSSIPIAGSTFTEQIAKELGMTTEKAEAIKRKVGVSNTPEYPNIQTILLPTLTNLCEEIKNILKFHYDHSEEKVTRIILSGGNATLTNLAQFVGSTLASEGLGVVVGEPGGYLPEFTMRPLNQNESLQYAATLGLAMRTLGESRV